jgi:hypothetical protein
MTLDGFRFDLAAAVLALLLLWTAFVLWRAARNGKFDFSQMLRDAEGKESALRLGVLVSLAISSWVVVKDALDGSSDPQLVWAYLFTWSGALVFVKAVEKWDGRLPWSKP